MSVLVARTGRQQQRYEDGCRLVAGGFNSSLLGRKMVFQNVRSVLTNIVIDRCIPFKYSCDENSDGTSKKTLEVLMISATSGPGLVFPKGGWENDETAEEAAVREALEEAGVRGELLDFLGYYKFKSKTLKDEFCPEGLCRASIFALHVKEELQCWPEQSIRQRSWLPILEAVHCCRHEWMRNALEESFLKWHADQVKTTSKDNNHQILSNSSADECS